MSSNNINSPGPRVFSTSLFSPGPSWIAPPPLVLPEEEQAKLDELVAYFGKEGYQVEVSEGAVEKKLLTEREMMFLVSFLAGVRVSSARADVPSRGKRSSGPWALL
jgi:hypothetical protein